MKNKGFTLIELLAVIVILAIIALIATPIVLGIIDDARISTREQTAQMIIDNVELAYSTAFMQSGETTTAGQAPTIDEVIDNFKMKSAVMVLVENEDGVVTPQIGMSYNETDGLKGIDGVTCTISNEELTKNKLKVECVSNPGNEENEKTISTETNMDLTPTTAATNTQTNTEGTPES